MPIGNRYCAIYRRNGLLATLINQVLYVSKQITGTHAG
jgi:hypothetical protein